MRQHLCSVILLYIPGPETSGSKFSTTWRPAGDYIHLKISFLVQSNTVQVLLHHLLVLHHNLEQGGGHQLPTLGHGELSRVLRAST